MRLRWYFLIFMITGCSHLKFQDANPLVNPFVALSPKKRPRELTSQSCPNPPPPVVEVMGKTYYKDSHHSVIDSKLHKESREMVMPLRTFNNQVARLSDRIWKYDDQKAEDCLYFWLNTWAHAGALLGDANYQGEFERKWNLSGIALAYLKIESLVHWNSEQRKVIVSWLEKVANRVRADFEQKLDRQSRRNNHIYWAGLSVMTVAISTNDHTLYQWGLNKAIQASKDVTAEGFLPEELDRGRRARHYQSFSLQALTMMAFLARNNGVDLYSLNNQAVHRLAQKTVEGYQEDSVFEKATSTPQEPMDPDDFQWSVVYIYHNPNKINFEPLKLGPSNFSPWLGGDLAAIFSTQKP